MKKYITITLLGLFTSSLIGCNISALRDDEAITSKKEEIQTLMTEHIEGKYDGDFTLSVPFILADSKFDEDRWMRSDAYNNSTPDDKFTVLYDLKENIILDYYEPLIYGDTISESFQGFVNTNWSDAIVKTEVLSNGACDSLMKHQDLNTYLEYDSPKLISRIFIPVKEYNPEAEIPKVRNFIDNLYDNKHLYGELHFIYIPTENVNETVAELVKLETPEYIGNSKLVEYKYLSIQQTITDKKIFDTFKNKEEE